MQFISAKNHLILSMVVSVVVVVAVAVAVAVPLAVPLASWGTTAATHVPRLRIGERPREWTRG